MFFWSAGGAAAVPKTVTIGGPFTLSAPDGRTVTEASFPGRWLLVFFGYTFCPDICPTTLTTVADALEALGEDAGRVQPVFISVDPARDTPEILGAYTAAFDPRILGLTGAPEQIAAVAKAYGAHYEIRQTDPADRFYAVDHSIYLYLLDPDGAFVRAMDLEETPERIAETLRALITSR